MDFESFKWRWWEEAGYNRFQAQSWIEAGVPRPDIAREWEDAGFNSKDVDLLRDVNIVTPAEGGAWKAVDTRYNGWHICIAFDCGIKNPKEAQKWAEAGIAVDEAAQLAEVKVTPADGAATLSELRACNYPIRTIRVAETMLKKVKLECPELARRIGNCHLAPMRTLSLVVDEEMREILDSLDDRELQRVVVTIERNFGDERGMDATALKAIVSVVR